MRKFVFAQGIQLVPSEPPEYQLSQGKNLMNICWVEAELHEKKKIFDATILVSKFSLNFMNQW